MIRVASYNIYHGGLVDLQMDVLGADIAALGADIVGLQEVYEDQVAEIAAAAGYDYSYFTFASQKEVLGIAVGKAYGTAILSKYAIKESATVEFNNEDVLGQPSEGLSEEPRSYGRVVLDVNGKDVAFYNTHLAGRQGEMLAYIMDKVNADVEAGLSVVVTGDFNYSHDEVRAVVGSDATVLNRNLESTVDNSYIDNIIVSNNMDFYWDNTTGNGVKVIESGASDHSLIYGYACLK